MPKILEDYVHQGSGRGTERSSSCTKCPSTSRRSPPRLSYPPGKSTCMAPPDGPECYRFSRNSKKLTATACNLKKVVRFNHLRNFTRQQIPVGVRPFSHRKSVKTWAISCSLPRKMLRFVICHWPFPPNYYCTISLCQCTQIYSKRKTEPLGGKGGGSRVLTRNEGSW